MRFFVLVLLTLLLPLGLPGVGYGQKQTSSEEADRKIEEAYQKSPDSPGILADYTFSLIRQGRTAEAREVADRLERVDVKNPRLPVIRDLLSELPGQTEGPAASSSPAKVGDAFFVAVAEGNVARVRSILSSGVDANATDRFGRTALEYACQAGHAEVVKLLLAKGADPNAPSSHGSTPLLLAAGNGHVAVVKALIAQKADVNAKSIAGVTPLMLATWKGYSEVVRLLQEAGAKE